MISHEQWEKMVEETIEHIRWLNKAKGRDYSRDEDRLAEFRDNAKDYGTRMELVWGTHAGKHWNAIRRYISDKVNGIEHEKSEPIEGRIDDMIMYLLLFKGIVQEEQKPHPLNNMAEEGWGQVHVGGKQQPFVLGGCYCPRCQRHFDYVNLEEHNNFYHKLI